MQIWSIPIGIALDVTSFRPQALTSELTCCVCNIFSETCGVCVVGNQNRSFCRVMGRTTSIILCATPGKYVDRLFSSRCSNGHRVVRDRVTEDLTQRFKQAPAYICSAPQRRKRLPHINQYPLFLLAFMGMVGRYAAHTWQRCSEVTWYENTETHMVLLCCFQCYCVCNITKYISPKTL